MPAGEPSDDGDTYEVDFDGLTVQVLAYHDFIPAGRGYWDIWDVLVRKRRLSATDRPDSE